MEKEFEDQGVAFRQSAGKPVKSAIGYPASARIMQEAYENRIAELEATLDAINGTSTLDLFFGALGWQGGTIHDAVETVRGQVKRIAELELSIQNDYAPIADYKNSQSRTSYFAGKVEEQAQCIKEMREALREYANSAQAYGRVARAVLERWPE